MISSSGLQLEWVPWNPQIFEKYEMESTDFEAKNGFILKVHSYVATKLPKLVIAIY